jgi:hypothetical protein
MIEIFSKIGATLGMNCCELNYTQPSAALVMMKVFPDLTARLSNLNI